MACVVVGLVEVITYRATAMAVTLVVILAVAMVAVAVFGLRARYARKAAPRRGVRANAGGVADDA